jgi:hypothetical protein
MFKKLRQSKDFRIFCFTVFNALVAFVGTQLAGIEWQSAVIVAWLAIPFLNAFTKRINVRFFNDLWVEK